MTPNELIEAHLYLVDELIMTNYRAWAAGAIFTRDEVRSDLEWGLVTAAHNWESYCERHGYSPENVSYFVGYACSRMHGQLRDSMRNVDVVTRTVRRKIKQGAEVAPADYRQPVSLTDDLAAYIADSEASTESQAEASGMLKVVVDTIRDMEPLAQAVLALHYFKGRLLGDVAKMLKISEHRASQVHMRAVLEVHQALRAYCQP